MREVVRHLNDLVGREPGQVLAHAIEQRLAREHLPVAPGAHFVAREHLGEARVVEPMRDLVDVVDRKTRLVEAVLNGPDRELRAVLAQIEAFLSGRRDDLTVDDECGRGVVALRHAVFPLFESRPLLFLEGNRRFDPADADDVHARSTAVARA